MSISNSNFIQIVILNVFWQICLTILFKSVFCSIIFFQKVQKCHGSETYPVLGSGPTSDEADDIKDIDCPDMTNALLLRSGDVELNPGPNDT